MGDSAVRAVSKLDHPQFDDFIRFRVQPGCLNVKEDPNLNLLV